MSLSHPQVCLRHPTTTLSKEIRNSIVSLMKKGLDEIIDIVRLSPSADTHNHEQILSKAVDQYMVRYYQCLAHHLVVIALFSILMLIQFSY